MDDERGCGMDSLVAGMVAVVAGVVVGAAAVTWALPKFLT